MPSNRRSPHNLIKYPLMGIVLNCRDILNFHYFRGIAKSPALPSEKAKEKKQRPVVRTVKWDEKFEVGSRKHFPVLVAPRPAAASLPICPTRPDRAELDPECTKKTTGQTTTSTCQLSRLETKIPTVSCLTLQVQVQRNKKKDSTRPCPARTLSTKRHKPAATTAQCVIHSHRDYLSTFGC